MTPLYSPPPLLVLPPDAVGLQIVASVSGGKDSTALILALIEAGIHARYVFADTGWEAPETYVYLDFLRKALAITIDVVRCASGGMRQSIRARARFPGRMQRWCTKELNEAEPGRYKHPVASFFQSRAGRRVCLIDHDHADNGGKDCKRTLVDAPPMQIDEIVAWSKTEHGGKQLPMFEPAPTGGCMRWGVCDVAPQEESDVAMVARDAALSDKPSEALALNKALLASMLARSQTEQPEMWR